MVQVALTPDRTPQGWSAVAQAYDEHIARFTRNFAKDALDATDLRANETVLDVAAGTGALSLQAARRGANVVATDFAPEMIERLRRRAAAESLPIEAHVMDGQALELPDASFDAAYSIFGVMFFPEPDRGLAQMRRVLRPGGRAGIVVWGPPERSEGFALMFDAMREAVPDLPEPPQPPAVFSLADPDDLANRMERAGFRDVEVRQVVHEMADESPQKAWEGMARSNPVVPGLLANVGPAHADKVREAFLRLAQERMVDGRLRLMGEAHLAVARA